MKKEQTESISLRLKWLVIKLLVQIKFTVCVTVLITFLHSITNT